MRFEMLEDALHICRSMFTQAQTTFEGKHAGVTGAWSSPQPVRPGGPPILIGGAGERRTLRLAAELADASNFNCGFDEVPHKLEVLAGHCETVGRDMADISTSCLGTAVIGRTHAVARQDQSVRAAEVAEVMGPSGARHLLVNGSEELLRFGVRTIVRGAVATTSQ